ncbi:baseplate hub protein [Methylorubrum suomiense]|uniref:baseplate hub protein n=1 Tax=Methylorubrum suomiense TaxID=144191 RepID=UPI00366ADDE7
MFGRIIRVTVEGDGGSATFIGDQSPEPGLSISGTCTQTIGSKPNAGTVTIKNLSQARRNMLGNEYDKVTVEFGWKGMAPWVLFSGDIRDVSHTKTSPEIETAIEVGDGDKAVGKGKASKTFPAGTKPKEIVEYLRKQMPGIAKGEIKGLDDLPATKRPTTVYGYAYRELDTIGRQHGFYWSLQNGKMQAVKADEHLGGNVLISAETGLLGVPTVTDKGVKVTTLIIPGLTPGRVIDVRSEFTDTSLAAKKDKRPTDQGGGLFRIASVAYTIASRDDECTAEIEANRIQGDKVKK